MDVAFAMYNIVSMYILNMFRLRLVVIHCTLVELCIYGMAIVFVR